MNNLPKIDYKLFIESKKQDNKKELQIFIFLKKNEIFDYESYIRICEIYGYEYESSENNFIKWFKKYEEGLKTRIKGFSEKSFQHIKYIERELLNGDDIAIGRLMKDSTRQSPYENYAIQHIKNNYPFIYKIKKLKDSGEHALYIYDNKIINGIEKELLECDTTKSIDFMWEYYLPGYENKTLRFYVTHKYTEGDGGAQTEQWQEVKDFLKTTREINSNDEVFLSITDGNYYIKKRRKGKTKLQELKDVCTTNNVFATTTNDLVYDMVPHIIRWLQSNYEECEIEDEIERLSQFINE